MANPNGTYHQAALLKVRGGVFFNLFAGSALMILYAETRCIRHQEQHKQDVLSIEDIGSGY